MCVYAWLAVLALRDESGSSHTLEGRKGVG